MRNVILIGAVLGISASVPILYEAAPETFHRLISPKSQDLPALATVTPDAPRASTSNRKARIDSDARGHFRSEIRLNGRRVDSMIDTGATYLAFNRSTARRLGLGVSNTDFRHDVNTANGKTKAALVRIDSIEIGRIRVENVNALVLDDSALKNTLVGMNVLKTLRRYEVRDGAMYLEQ